MNKEICKHCNNKIKLIFVNDDRAFATSYFEFRCIDSNEKIQTKIPVDKKLTDIILKDISENKIIFPEDLKIFKSLETPKTCVYYIEQMLNGDKYEY